MQHPAGGFEAEFAQIWRSGVAQNFHYFDDLERVADHVAQRLIHVGDHRDDLFTHALAGLDHELGEEGSVFLVFHERARAGFHVEHERIDSFRQFLAHDGRADQVWTLDRAGDVAEGVEFAIGGSDLGGLADHGAAADVRAGDEIQRPKDLR